MGPILLVFVVIIVLMALARYQEELVWPVIRAALQREGFQNGKYTTVKDWLPDPGFLTKKASCDEDAPAP